MERFRALLCSSFRFLMQSCRTARAQVTRGSTAENDCELKDDVVEAVEAADGELGGNAGLLDFKKFPSKSNIGVSATEIFSLFSFLDEVKLELSRMVLRLGFVCCGENANMFAPASGALISVSSLTSGKK